MAKVDTESCAACGKYVEPCPAGAIKLVWNLCTADGPISYPQMPLPEDNRFHNCFHCKCDPIGIHRISVYQAEEKSGYTGHFEHTKYFNEAEARAIIEK